MGRYKVTKSNRKNKTHKVEDTKTGEVQHFGDPNLKNKPNNPKAKKAAEARHKKNLKSNPLFRAYWRKTWDEGGSVTEDILKDPLNENFINSTGYTDGSTTENNTFNIIPSNGDITMDNVYEELLAMKVDKDGNVNGFKFMEPNKDYNFKNTKSVVEIPTYKKGGKSKEDWISDKISKLLKEGTAKNRDQAVAIAYSMYNSDKNYQVGGGFNLFEQLGFIQPMVQENDINTQLLPNTIELSDEELGITKPQVSTAPTSSTPQEVNLITEKLAEEQSQTSTTNTTQQLTDKVNQEKDQLKLREREQIQFFNPYAGVDIPTAAATLGQGIESGNTLQTVGSALKLGTGLTRNIFGAMGRERRKNYVQDQYLQKQKEGMNTLQFFQDGGELEDLVSQLLSQQQNKKQVPSISNLDLGKYKNVGYFDTMSLGDNKFVLKNTRKNPQNAASIRQQLDLIRKQNPNAIIDFQYQSFQDGGNLTEEDYIILNKELPVDLDPTILDQLFEKNMPLTPTQAPEVNLGKYSDVGYFDVLENKDDIIRLMNTKKSPHTRETINSILPTLQKLNPNRKVEVMFQDGGEIDGMFDNFEEDLLSQLMMPETPTATPMEEFNMGKYGNLNYFNVTPTKSGYEISNTDINPQNAAGFKEQLRQLQKVNPNAELTMKYLPKMKKGGKVDPDMLTGEYITGVDQNDPQQMKYVTGEVEDGEYYKTKEGDIAEVVGDKHSEGGEKMLMEAGDKVLTDHTKLGAKNAKTIRDKYDLDIKAKHTYSDVLDKFRKKMGLDKLVKEEEELIEKLEKEQEKKDSNSKSLNIDFLRNKINTITKKKEPIEEARKVLYDNLFEIQEKSKPKQERSEEFQDGGEKQEIIEGQNPYDIDEDFINQSIREGFYFGKADKERLNDLQRNFPFLVEQTFDIKRSEDGQIEDVSVKEGESILNFQKAVNSNYQSLIEDARTKLQDPSRIKSFEDKVKQEMFNNDLVARGFDDKFGNFTSSRRNFGFRAVTKEDLEKLRNQGITTYKQLVNPDGSLKEGIDISEDSKKLLSQFKDFKSNFLLGDRDPESMEGKKTLQRTESFIPNTQQQKAEKDMMSLALLPDQYPLQPDSLEPHLKISRRFDRLEAQQIDPEPFLNQLFQQQQTANRKLEGLPPSVKTAAQANVNANTQNAIAQAMLNIETANMQSRQQANVQNAGIQRQQENSRVMDALNYERRSMLAKNIYNQNIRNYFNNLQQVNKRNFEDIRDLSLLNELYDDVSYSTNGEFSVSQAPDFKNQIENLKSKIL